MRISKINDYLPFNKIVDSVDYSYVCHHLDDNEEKAYNVYDLLINELRDNNLEAYKFLIESILKAFNKLGITAIKNIELIDTKHFEANFHVDLFLLSKELDIFLKDNNLWTSYCKDNFSNCNGFISWTESDSILFIKKIRREYLHDRTFFYNRKSELVPGVNLEAIIDFILKYELDACTYLEEFFTDIDEIIYSLSEG